MDLPDLARSRAILIGNGSYAEDPRIPNLPGARACVQAMTELLTGPLCGWPTERVTPLEDLTVPSELAVRVVEAVRDAEDVLLVYYVGHGMRTFDGQLALALSDTRPHPEALPHTAMLYPSLASILRGARAPTKLVVLDCCHAELGHRANYIFQSADMAEAYPVDGLYFIGASARDAKAKAPIDGGLTYFTDAFVTTVTTGIPRQAPTLRLDQIFLELRARLLRANLPEPVEAGTRGAHQFPFARNAAPQELLLDPDTEIARLRREKTEAEERERALREEHARELQRLREQQSHTAPGTALPAEPPHPKAPESRRSLSTATTASTTYPDPPGRPHMPPNTHVHKPALPSDPAQRRPAFSRRGLLITAAVAALGSGIGGAVWALTTDTPALAPALRSTLTGFHSYVNSVAFSAVGHTLAAGSDDETVRLWNVTDPAHPVSLGSPLTGFTANVNSVVFSPDGHTLAVGSSDETVRLWNVTDPAHPVSLGSPLTGFTANVNSVVFSPDGHTLAVGSSDETVRLWNVTDPAHPVSLGSPLTGFTAVVTSVAFSAVGHTLAAVTYVGVQLWNVTDPAHPVSLGSLTGFTSHVASVAFSPDGHTLAVGSSDETVRLWNVTDPAHPVSLGSPLTGFTAVVTSVAFSPHGHTLAAGSSDETVRLWNVTDPAHPVSLGSPLTGFTAVVTSVAFSPDGHTLAAVTYVGVQLWALR